jgi:hypothetical protein
LIFFHWQPKERERKSNQFKKKEVAGLAVDKKES